MLDWKPISESALLNRIKGSYARMPLEHKRLWDAIRIEPIKWQQHPYGDAGGGFWVVAVIGRTVIWYNDIEEGFNRSVYTTPGEIADYLCNDDELEVTVAYLANVMSGGHDLAILSAEHKRLKEVSQK